MSDLIDVVIEDTRWEVCGLESLAKAAIENALGIVDIAPDIYEICILACNDDRISQLNAEFREKATPTNVLSWPAYELSKDEGEDPNLPPQPNGMDDSLGDIAISYDTCAREAVESSIEFADHVTHLIIHGCLHLLGYDHENDKDATLMETLEVKALARMGIKNPY